ncbi:MAG: OmpA family protein [Pseudomonadales bacterium]|jgi:outer membrane protein OmpA-like peptidoglycan-associated protein|nr:OmpA family protein [Pseudomonadales bacterium]
MKKARRSCSWLLSFCLAAGTASAEDIDGAIEHPLISRYPDQEIRWQQIENHRPYRVPAGPVTGYRTIDDWIDTEGRVTRTFYRYQGTERSFSEIYRNYLDALEEQDFEILVQGISPDRRGRDTGSRAWLEVLFIENPTSRPGEVGTLFSGTSSSGGAGAIVARKERAAGLVYAVVVVEQHAVDYVGTLIDIVEVEEAETGLIVVDPEAMGADLDEYGRVVLSGIVFEFDRATLRPESDAALNAIAAYLDAHPDRSFYVVGHTDSVGSFAYNEKLSADRARAVADALKDRFGIAAGRLEPHGIGPLVPVYSNGSEAGREQNRRVELVERPAGD